MAAAVKRRTRTVGVNRVRVAPQMLPTPPHWHTALRGGFLRARRLGARVAGRGRARGRPRDCVIHRANKHEHTFIAGEDGLEYLAFGTRHPTEVGWLPRSRAIRFGWPWVEGRRRPVGHRGRRASRSPTANPRRGRRTSSTSTRSSSSATRAASTTAPLATTRPFGLAILHWEQLAPGSSRLASALPLQGGRGVRHPRGQRDAGAWPSPPREAAGEVMEEHCVEARPSRREAAGDESRARIHPHPQG